MGRASQEIAWALGVVREARDTAPCCPERRGPSGGLFSLCLGVGLPQGLQAGWPHTGVGLGKQAGRGLTEMFVQALLDSPGFALPGAA